MREAFRPEPVRDHLLEMPPFEDYKQKALAILQTYPSSPYKDSLALMVNYVIERKK